MRIEDLFRLLEARMPATQGPDGKLRRATTLEGWHNMKEEVTKLVKRAGGIHVPKQPIPSSHALTIVPPSPPEPPDPLGPAEFDPENTFPVIHGETIRRSLM